METKKQKTARKPNRKELFTVIGEMRIVGEKKRFVPDSQRHMNSEMNRVPFNKKIAVSFAEHVPTRSGEQLRYHMVLVGYIAEDTGYTKKEIHDFIMRVVFGEKDIILGGIRKSVRKSVADDAKMPMAEMSWLIRSDLALCNKLGIEVPTAAELGYVSNSAQYIDADYKIEDYPEFDGPTAFG